MKKVLHRLLDHRLGGSLAGAMRLKRFRFFRDLIQHKAHHALDILDIGGTETFWARMGFLDSGHFICLLDLDKPECRHPNVSSIAGDARDMKQFRDRQFDVAFSNSVIEHIPTLEGQARMAREIQRVADTYYVQTPNFFFPFEPHFLLPFVHWFPMPIRVRLIRMFPLGWYPPEEARCIRLMKKSELKTLFPNGVILHERFLGLTKSFIIVKA